MGLQEGTSGGTDSREPQSWPAGASLLHARAPGPARARPARLEERLLTVDTERPGRPVTSFGYLNVLLSLSVQTQPYCKSTTSCLGKNRCPVFSQNTKEAAFTQALHGRPESFCIGPLIESGEVGHSALENLRWERGGHRSRRDSHDKLITRPASLLSATSGLHTKLRPMSYATPLATGSGPGTVQISGGNAACNPGDGDREAGSRASALGHRPGWCSVHVLAGAKPPTAWIRGTLPLTDGTDASGRHAAHALPAHTPSRPVS